MAEEPTHLSGRRAGLRADAASNRTRILEAARAAFAQRGIDVPLSTIARRAGVATATLFRRFPTKRDLVVEVFAGQVRTCEAMVATALADPDPWHGFCGLLESARVIQLGDRGFTHAFLAAYPEVLHDDGRVTIERDFAELVRRAKATGRLRADFSSRDLPLILLAQMGVTATPPEIAEAASRRVLAYLIQSFDTSSGTDPARALPPPPAVDIQTVIDVRQP
ncbi:TetR/AcrR family transcriptional regulator [Umezawaea endophytica]|uniref:TetR/AcrR family transcriptional regulator n=1 Tax=Umezawaea endophytica TaxID=1654476 RepID=A0A9X2VKL7_9PSEU|nr:TetR/AcrR family transcriptional regulator [Umezawaea endophytica]MCS7476888.1 TetR/AcrR family transcriptional regulator [Umezawaea endophytica]